MEQARSFYTALLTLLFTLSTPLALADHLWSDDWDIEVSGKAAGPGEMGFKVQFEPAEDGTTQDPVEVTVPVAKKAKAKAVTDFIANAFKASLSAEQYKVKGSGDKVKIHARKDAPDFNIVLTGNTVPGIGILIDD